MTLEDFFTLTEMKDGLTAPSRVQDLVSIMQKEKTSVVKNIGDATRQWASVASTIAATDNRDCLDLFIQLDGLQFIDRWLEDVQTFSVDANDSFTEESITALLRALEKLNIDGERSISSGICATVRNLLVHHSSRVRDKARALFDGWKLDEKGDLKSPSLVLAKVNSGNEIHDREDGVATPDDALSKEKGRIESNFFGSGRDENSPPGTTDNIQPEMVADTLIEKFNDQPHSQMDVVSVDTKDQNGDHLSNLNNSVQYPTKKGSPLCPEDNIASIGTCSFPDVRPGGTEGQSEVSRLKEVSNNETQVHDFSSLPEKPGIIEVPPSSKKGECSDEGNVQRSLREPTSQNNAGDGESGICQNVSLVDGMTITVPNQYSDVDNLRNIQEVQEGAGNGGSSFNASHGLIVGSSKSRKPVGLEASFSRIASAKVLDEKTERVSNGSENKSCNSDSPPAMKAKSQNVIDKRRPDIELDYGFDALQVARQVAQEVEREVGDPRESFCSSSPEKISEGGGIIQPGSPDSIGKQYLPADVLPKASASTSSDSTEAYSEAGEERAANSENSVPHTVFTSNMASSVVAEASQKPDDKSEQGGCIFDLNEEVCSDDKEIPVNAASTHIPVVSAPRQASTSGLPAVPLHFEGALGWKGSAATSAFRPASSRKTSDLDKNISLDGTSETSKQRQGGLDIDLNVAVGIDGLEKNTAVFGLPSRESPVEKRSGKLNLDLNSMSDDGETQTSDPRMEKQLLHRNRNRNHSASPASSSSTLQPSIRNIDLNGPYSHNDLVEQGQGKFSHLGNPYQRPKSDAPAISILGTRVEVNKKEYAHASQFLPFPHGKAIEPAMDFSNVRGGGILGIVPTVSYSHSPVFGYHEPNMSLSPAIYGSGGTIPYMVDSRGAPVMPQIMGSNSTVLPAYSQPPYVVNMSGLQPGLNGVGSSRQHLDLNSGFLIDAGNNESFRQFLIPGGGMTLEDHSRSIPQPSSSGIVGKRKEPDSGWESYPFNYKQQQPPWK